jgi:hypothetical protein
LGSPPVRKKKQQPLNLLFTFHDEKFLTLMHI